MELTSVTAVRRPRPSAPSAYDVPRPAGWNPHDPRSWEQLAAATWEQAAAALRHGDDADAERLQALARQRDHHAEAVRLAGQTTAAERSAANPGVPLDMTARHQGCRGAVPVAMVYGGNRLVVSPNRCRKKGCPDCDPVLATSHAEPMLDWLDANPDARLFTVDIDSRERRSLTRRVREAGGQVRYFPAHGDRYQAFANVDLEHGIEVADPEQASLDAYDVAMTCAAFGDKRRIGGTTGWARTKPERTDENVEVLGVVTTSARAAWATAEAVTGVAPVPVRRRQAVDHRVLRRPDGRTQRVPIWSDVPRATGAWWVPLDPVYTDELIRGLGIVPHDELYRYAARIPRARADLLISALHSRAA